MKIFLTGSTGQVGFELARDLSSIGKLLAPTRTELDLSDLGAVQQYLDTHQPDLIVNPAAWTAVDAAEDQVQNAQVLNEKLPALLANFAAKNCVPMVHYSTDYVYPGDGEKSWTESSPTAPLSVYGQTKLAGDVAVQASGCSYLIFRTSWVYAARGNNFMKTMLRLGSEREALSIVSDQVGAPTPARLISSVSALAISRLMGGQIDSGVYHLVSSGFTSWHEFACQIFERASHKTPLTISKGSVTPIASSEYPTPAKRPLNSRLCVKKLEQALTISLPDWQSQLQLTLDEYLSA